MGLAVLTQLRAQLMDAQFNECILLFSDMPAVDIDNVVSTSMDIFCTTPPSLSWRQHDSADSVAGRSGPLDMTQLSIGVLKAEKVGRVSGADLLNLLDSGKLVVVDTRTPEEWRLGSLQGSTNLPAASAFGASGELAGGVKEVEQARKKGQVVCVLGSVREHSQVVAVAEGLLGLGVARVAVLHGGVEVFRTSGRLVVPHL